MLPSVTQCQRAVTVPRVQKELWNEGAPRGPNAAWLWTRGIVGTRRTPPGLQVPSHGRRVSLCSLQGISPSPKQAAFKTVLLVVFKTTNTVFGFGQFPKALGGVGWTGTAFTWPSGLWSRFRVPTHPVQLICTLRGAHRALLPEGGRMCPSGQGAARSAARTPSTVTGVSHGSSVVWPRTVECEHRKCQLKGT